MKQQTITAQVNSRLLDKASRLFTGTLDGRIIEILQNARRAGATRVEIVNCDDHVTVHDNGKGIEDFATLLDLGGSGWDEGKELEQSEDPAGVGLFCLSPREVIIRSNGKLAVISQSGWTGQPVHIATDPDSVKGTQLRFPDDTWRHDTVTKHAVFSGMNVTVDGKACEREPFVSSKAATYPKLGCRVEVIDTDDLSEQHRVAAHAGCVGHTNVIVNFHGQIAGFIYRPVGDHRLYFLIDMTNQPTGIRLMLPARTQLIENDAFKQLKKVIEREAYLYFHKLGEHSLPYDEYLRARELGIDLPEAKPKYEVGLLSADLGPEPVEVTKPKDLPLKHCYVLGAKRKTADDTDEANTHLLAALGKFKQPFVPVAISNAYQGYSWAKLPTIDRIELAAGKEIHQSWVCSGNLTCVESILLTAHCSDSERFCSKISMAAKPWKKQDGEKMWYGDYEAYVTPEVRENLADSQIWFHLGGFNEDSDTYETQEYEFSRQLDEFWTQMYGPDEPLRAKLMDCLTVVKEKWQSVTVLANGHVIIKTTDGNEKVILPPRSNNYPAPGAGTGTP